MKSRNPGFVPGRVTLAREAAGLTKTDLAQLMGAADAAVGNYESGARTPNPEKLLALCQHLGQKEVFFFQPLPARNNSVIFHRSMRAAERIARERSEAYLSYLWETLDYLRTLAELPAMRMPKLGAMPEPQHITDSMIEAAAKIAREHWNLGDRPIPNLVWLLEGSGVIVMRINLENDKMDSLSLWREVDGRPYVLLNTTRPHGAFRSRMDLAHELGHLLLHRAVTEEQLKDNAVFKMVEEQAWKFAHAFLLPKTEFMRDVYSLNLNVLRSLKPKWKVSMAFMLLRIHGLGILTDEKYGNYRKYLAKNDWLHFEPYDKETLPEKPMLLKQLIDFLAENRIQTAEQIVASIHLSPLDLETITGVDAGYFTVSRPTNIPFTPKQRVS